MFCLRFRHQQQSSLKGKREKITLAKKTKVNEFHLTSLSAGRDIRTQTTPTLISSFSPQNQSQ